MIVASRARDIQTIITSQDVALRSLIAGVLIIPEPKHFSIFICKNNSTAFLFDLTALWTAIKEWWDSLQSLSFHLASSISLLHFGNFFVLFSFVAACFLSALNFYFCFLAPIVHLKVLIPSIAAGAVIGKDGEAIERIQKESGAKVKMSKRNDFYPGLISFDVLKFPKYLFSDIKCCKLSLALLILSVLKQYFAHV